MPEIPRVSRFDSTPSHQTLSNAFNMFKKLAVSSIEWLLSKLAQMLWTNDRIDFHKSHWIRTKKRLI